MKTHISQIASNAYFQIYLKVKDLNFSARQPYIYQNNRQNNTFMPFYCFLEMKKPVASWYFFWFIMFYRSANRTNTKFYPFSRPFLKSNGIIVSFSKFIHALALLTNPFQAKGMLHKNIILWSPVGEPLRTHNGHYKQDSACNTGTTFRWCSWIYIRIIWVIVVRISINFSSFI